MQLLDDWRSVLKEAWSIKWISAGVILLLLDLGAVLLEFFGVLADRPLWSLTLRVGATFCGVASFVARLLYQARPEDFGVGGTD